MANPQPTDAHLRIAHSITEAIMLRDFSKRQRKILDLILRLSWGCGKKSAVIPHQKDFCVVGLYETDIKKEITWLIESKIITKEENNYSFNKDFDQWQISRVFPYEPEKLSELLSINLNGHGLSKTLSSEGLELSKTLSENLVKHKEKTLYNTKFSTPELATPKESIKEILNKDITDIYQDVIEDELLDFAQKLGFSMLEVPDKNTLEYALEHKDVSPVNKNRYEKLLEFYRAHEEALTKK